VAIALHQIIISSNMRAQTFFFKFKYYVLKHHYIIFEIPALQELLM
jgi:hypothetical protein